ncbi:DNA polymerase III subunit epsilon [Salinicoccus luteus]|uniref:DNA polymerase III subunit epsilon n=1 Tax=Salinicoccus luteus TaxID=367840 RepID=UPI0004E18207|nr:DNA polymerase III subunit epsilon [Salinicoccus luteus]
MGLFRKLFFGKKETKRQNREKQSEENYEIREPIQPISPKINEDFDVGISISSSPVGVSTGSAAKDYYVYHWYLKDTGEIFYVGKGRKDRYKRYHERTYEAEKIRKMYDTDTRFVKTDLTEEEAIELESQEMTRILNDTNHRLTNRITPLMTNRGNGYDRSPKTPELEFETAPYLYPSEIEEHYFGIKPRAFDQVKYNNLKRIVFDYRNIHHTKAIYGGNLDNYLSETKAFLEFNGTKILKTKYAKSVTAWIYIGDDYITNYELEQKKALEKIGRNVPTYHLIDVWKLLKEKFDDIEIELTEEIEIQPVHHRVLLKDIRNLHDWSKGFDEGHPYWEQGDKERKKGNIEKAIELFDKSRYNGYSAPVLYKSYAMAYRKLKDYDNEIAILDEAIERLTINNEPPIHFKERRERAIDLKQKSK